ncbi:MAG: DUF411 domain-containing protein [Aquabacterium sp.]
MNRRHTLTRMMGLMALLAPPTTHIVGVASPRRPLVEVWKDPHCGCCQDWVDHLKAHGFEAKVYDEGNAEMRQRLGMPKQLGSCHTARVQGYVIEGHVPATDIQRLLREHPRALGLAVPGMPIGSPGMDGPAYGGRRDRYEVLLVTRDGRHSVYNTHS